jgi:putative zinc finger protein
MSCELWDAPEIELYFYGELDEVGHARVAAHLRSCAACRQRLDDLRAIRRALAARPVVDAPPGGDWSGFMRRLDAAVGPGPARPAAVLERRGTTWRVRHLAALAATLAIAASGVFMAARVRHTLWLQPSAGTTSGGRASSLARPSPTPSASLTPAAALRDISAEHLEKSKLVVLGLAARDPQKTRPADWQYERRLAGTLLSDTRLYRLAAQEHGAADVAHVMRDLETVLLEASMSDHADRESLERVQRLIARRGLVTKMQLVANAP